jgi:hypothetical protein
MGRLRTDFLFAQPSFLSGLARVFDLFSTFDEYNRSPNERIADARALYSDWKIVGWDLFDEMQKESKAQVAAPKQMQLFSKAV